MEIFRVFGMFLKDFLFIVIWYYIVVILILLIVVYLYYEYCMEFCCLGEDMLVRWLKGSFGGGMMGFFVFLSFSLSG